MRKHDYGRVEFPISGTFDLLKDSIVKSAVAEKEGYSGEGVAMGPGGDVLDFKISTTEKERGTGWAFVLELGLRNYNGNGADFSEYGAIVLRNLAKEEHALVIAVEPAKILEGARSQSLARITVPLFAMEPDAESIKYAAEALAYAIKESYEFVITKT